MKNQNDIQTQQSVFIQIFSIFVFCNVVVLNEMLKLFKLYFIFPNKKPDLLTVVMRFEIYYFHEINKNIFEHYLACQLLIEAALFFFFHVNIYNYLYLVCGCEFWLYADIPGAI